MPTETKSRETESTRQKRSRSQPEREATKSDRGRVPHPSGQRRALPGRSPGELGPTRMGGAGCWRADLFPARSRKQKKVEQKSHERSWDRSTTGLSADPRLASTAREREPLKFQVA